MASCLRYDPRVRRQAAGLALFGLVATALALSADRWVASAFAAAQTDAGRQVVEVFSALGTGWADFGLAFALIAAGWAMGRSAWLETGLRGGVAVAAAGIASQVIKHLACRARPGYPGAGTFFHGVPCLGSMWGLFSFPSGHAATAAALAAVLGLRVPALRLPAAAGVAAVMVARVYLGAHFPSDVLAGATIGGIAGILAAAPANSIVPAAPTAHAGLAPPPPPGAVTPR